MTEAWDGRPQDPERDGWHWLDDGRVIAAKWIGELQGWVENGVLSGQAVADLGFRYLGPCLTPAEVAAREAASAEAMRKALYSEAIQIADALQDNGQTSCAAGAERVRLMIGRATIPNADALSRALAAAEKRGMEKAKEAIASYRAVEISSGGEPIPHAVMIANQTRDTLVRIIDEAIRNAAAQEIEP